MKSVISISTSIFMLGLISSPGLAYERPPTTQDIDKATDIFFYQVNPGLDYHQKLKTSDTKLKQEWQAIRNVTKGIIVNIGHGCRFDWKLKQYDGVQYSPSRSKSHLISADLNDVTDAVFAARHPTLMGRKIRQSETDFVREWQRIRTQVSTLPGRCD
jgi:hypothetical protein